MSGLSVSENILLVVSALGILQGLLLAALIYFHPKSDRSVNVFLALFILCVSMVLSTPITLKIVPWYNNYFSVAAPLLSGPFLVLYIRSFRKKIPWQRVVAYQLPFLVLLVYSFWYLSAMRAIYPDATEIPKEIMRHPLAVMVNIFKLGMLLVFIFLAGRELRVYQRSIRQVFSETSRINMNWARWLINGFLFIIISSIILYLLMTRYPNELNLWILINIAIGTPYIYIVTFKGIMQPSIWQTRPDVKKEKLEAQLEEADTSENQEFSEKPKAVKSGLTEERVNEMVNRIIAAMEKDKLYQETELTLQDLANKLSLPAHQVSYALNEGMKKNFYDVINSYRVEEAKRLLLDPKTSNYTVLSVGFEAGFNSKTTFNTVFKKFTGQTPTVFREHQRSKVSVV